MLKRKPKSLPPALDATSIPIEIIEPEELTEDEGGVLTHFQTV